MTLFNIKNVLISGAMASLLMSCAVGKKYTRTDLQIPETYKESVQVDRRYCSVAMEDFFQRSKIDWFNR
ncbi:hypothetical protein AB1278_00230 [Chryseobacterium sp. NRRL B-14798]|uniref:hypothetical protein n=1 Tax=Chryseobacterium sp. NRRL B-14798 TaxID=3162880 RepID=UPI003D20EF83